MSADRSPEARRLQAQDLERRALSVQRAADESFMWRTLGFPPPAGHALSSGPAAAAAIVYVAPDGTLTVACSCGEDLAHPSGRERYTLQRLTAHMELHATAAAAGVPWEEVRARQARLAARRD